MGWGGETEQVPRSERVPEPRLPSRGCLLQASGATLDLAPSQVFQEHRKLLWRHYTTSEQARRGQPEIKHQSDSRACPNHATSRPAHLPSEVRPLCPPAPFPLLTGLSNPFTPFLKWEFHLQVISFFPFLLKLFVDPLTTMLE